jgi:hypothetical protein
MLQAAVLSSDGCCVLLLQELKYEVAKGRALREERHRPSIDVMLQAANAMVLLACDPEAQTQHPSTDLSAAAAAAVRSAVNGAANAGSSGGSSSGGSSGGSSSGGSSGGSSSGGSNRNLVTQSFLPPLGSLPDYVVLQQVIRGSPTCALKSWLQELSKCECPWLYEPVGLGWSSLGLLIAVWPTS